MLIDLFIEAGWYTVPLKGKLERLPDGKKTLPIFEEKWRKKYTETFSETRSKLAGTITGNKSGIIAIDCDNDVTYAMFKAMDPEYNFHFVSKGKPTGGGTIIYKYTDEIGSFRIHTDVLALDFYADDGYVYLPTEDNHTKESWVGTTELPELKEAPSTIIAMLATFKSKTAPEGVAKNEAKHTISNRLAPMLANFIKSKAYDPILFRVLTPYAFRDLPQYVTKGHLHPDDVPRGRGSEYLTKVSAILGADISINIELYTNTMMLITTLGARFTHWPKDKLMSTVINPMIEGRSSIDGHPIWQYDPHWEKMGFIATSLNGDYIESFYDDIKGAYYLINYTVPYIRVFHDKRPLITTVRTLLGRTVTDQQYDSTKQLIRTCLNPSLEFGHVEGTDTYNLFRQTPELAVLNDPAPYKTQYNRPHHIIKYFESLIPDDFMRAYVLSFIKTKLTTFKYSPVILYLIGKPGSGKDTMIGILRQILGSAYIAKPDTKVFLEQYNGWMIDKFLIQLDEYGNKLVRQTDKQEVLGKLKAYTGSAEMQIRAMRTDGFNYIHSTTFILTANSNPLPIELDDRRIGFVKTPNKLAKEDWVIEAGGVSHVVEQLIPSEIMDFCYYLATEIPTLKSDDYVIAPETADKENLILESLPAVEQLCHYVLNQKWKELLYIAEEYNIKEFHEGWEKGRLMDAKLGDLYEAMTEGHGVHRTLIRKFKEVGMHRSHTTKNKANCFYYYVENLHKFKPIEKPEYEQTVSAKDSGVKGLS